MKKMSIVKLISLSLFVSVSFSSCGTKPQDTPTSSTTEKTPAVTTTTEGTSTTATYPLNTDVSLRVFSLAFKPQQSYTSWEDSPFHTNLQKQTGIKVEWEFPKAGMDTASAVNMMIASGDLPDILYTYRQATGAQDLSDGLIQPLNDAISKYAPNYTEFMKKYPSVASSGTTEDGVIWSLQSARETPWGNTYMGPLIRKDWLDEQGLSIPVTIEDWDNVLKVFKEKYNAQFMSTLIRVNAAGPGGAFDAFGTFDIDRSLYVDNGTIKLGQLQPEWKNYITQLNTWFTGGLIDPDMVTADDQAVRTKATNEKTGLVVLNLGSVDLLNSDAKAAGLNAQWIGIPYPVNSNGELHWSQGSNNLGETVPASITSACTGEKLEVAMRWLDYAYSEDGYYTWNFGEEGTSYTMVDNKPVYTDKILKDPDGINEAIDKYAGNQWNWLGLQSENLVRQKVSQGANDAVDAWLVNFGYDKYQLPEGLTLNADETTKANEIFTNLRTYVSEESLKFVTGDNSLTDMDKFIEKAKKDMKADEYVSIYQGAYDRLKK